MSIIDKILKHKTQAGISIAAIMCAVQFVSECIDIIKTHALTQTAISQLASSANGFETVILFFAAIAIKNKK